MAIPEPEVGLVISYSYLWHSEHQAGQDEGRKDRPSVIVLVVDREPDGPMLVTVLPITHSAPQSAAEAVEIPSAIKRHLSLDDQKSWIVVSEGNEFLWPGFDLCRIPQTGPYAYGYLPPRFFTQVQLAFLAWHNKAAQSVTSRT